jgi:predicted DNA-binding transcriptional regulator AlpA
MEQNKMQAENESSLIRRDEVANRLNICPRTVNNLCSTGKIPKPLKIGNSIRWDPKELDSWISAGCPEFKKENSNEA